MSIPASSTWSLTTLVLANLVPLAGVVWWGWDLGWVMILYWLENGVIGLFALLKMLLHDPVDSSHRIGEHLSKLFILPFFTVHYGAFWIGHGLFVISLFGSGLMSDNQFSPLDMQQRIVDLVRSDGALAWALAALVISHGVSFVANYLARGEYRQGTLQAKMVQPYGRVVVLHITIMLGGGFILVMKQPYFALVLLIVLKIAVDGRAHLREHRASA